MQKDGISVCKKGEEKYDYYETARKGVFMFQYDYRHTDGDLFTCVKPLLKDCRAARDKWLADKIK